MAASRHTRRARHSVALVKLEGGRLPRVPQTPENGPVTMQGSDLRQRAASSPLNGWLVVSL